MIKLLRYNNSTNKVEINEPDILLIKEFKDLSDADTTKNKVKFFKQLQYIYLFANWLSPYKDATSKEKHDLAMEDCGLTKEDFKDKLFKKAFEKYNKMQSTSIVGSLLKEVNNLLRKLEIKYKHMDLDERNDSGYINNTNNLQKEIQGLNLTVESLKELEINYYSDLMKTDKLRGDAEKGYFD